MNAHGLTVRLGAGQVGKRDPVHALSMLHAGETGIKWIAFLVALAVHVSVLVIDFPDLGKAVPQPRKQNVIFIKKYVPPPPPIERPRRQVEKKFTRLLPVPDPTPEEPEPIREPEPEILPEVYPDDAVLLIGVPSPPPAAAGPLLPGVGGVTPPARVEASYVEPQYPELARKARIEGEVILQAVIRPDGVVEELEVLRCTQPHVGFEEAAIEAVRQWLYEPATQNGRPVAVYFTVVVDFSLL